MMPVNEDELTVMCKILNYNNYKTKIAVKFFAEKWGIKEVWLWLCDTEKYPPEYDSVKRMKYRIQNDLIELMQFQEKFKKG